MLQKVKSSSKREPTNPTLDPAYQAASARYWRELPELLKTKLGKWVAFTENGLIAEAETQDEVLKCCDELGLKVGQFITGRIEPETPVLEVWGGDTWEC